MGFASRNAAGETVTAPASSPVTPHPDRSSARGPNFLPRRGDHVAGSSNGFENFATDLRHGIGPVSLLEGVLADRLVLAAWRLHLVSRGELASALDGDHLPEFTRETLRAERSLETALSLLEAARAARLGRPAAADSRDADADAAFETFDALDDLGAGDLANEWPTLPDHESPELNYEDEEDDDSEIPVRWQDRLVFDFNVSESSPVVRGTWVTVGHVVSLIVDGWTWADVLRTHPELTEDDIRTCLAYTVERDVHGDL